MVLVAEVGSSWWGRWRKARRVWLAGEEMVAGRAAMARFGTVPAEDFHALQSSSFKLP